MMFQKLTELIDELVANLSPIDSQVWKWAWLGSTIQIKKWYWLYSNLVLYRIKTCSNMAHVFILFLLGCSRRRRFLFRWHKRKTAIITILITPKPRPMTTYSFISDSLTPTKAVQVRIKIIRCISRHIAGLIRNYWKEDSNLQDCSSDWSRFPCSSRPQLCIPLQVNCLEIQNLEYLHWNISGGHCSIGPFTSVQVALNPLAPTDLFAI